jgi:C1A family cysteine protease
MPTKPIRKYGYLASKIKDKSAPKFFSLIDEASLPAVVDLRPKMPPVYNQGKLGCCTANAIAGALEFDLIKQKLPDFVPSRLFIYYNERVVEGTVDQDAGAELQDGIHSVAKLGVPPETLWTYSDDDIKFKEKPSPEVYVTASHHKSIQYSSLAQNILTFKQCLASGYPFVFGFTVYSNFEGEQVAQSGELNFPDFNNEQVLGGHAVLAVGYDDHKKVFIIRNSWGAKGVNGDKVGWGINGSGYFTIPYEYLVGKDDQGNLLASDFWKITHIV